jgi:hypothetical protein
LDRRNKAYRSSGKESVASQNGGTKTSAQTQFFRGSPRNASARERKRWWAVASSNEKMKDMIGFNLSAPKHAQGMFSSRIFLKNDTVAISLLFDKYYPIMD